MTPTIAGTGSCRKCGLQKTSVNKGDPICLNCDMPENKPSGLVNRASDPGHAVMIAVEAGQRIAPSSITGAAIPPTTGVPVASDMVHLCFTLDELEIEGLQDLVIKRIIEALDELPCPKMKDAKRIMKIQDKLEAK